MFRRFLHVVLLVGALSAQPLQAAKAETLLNVVDILLGFDSDAQAWVAESGADIDSFAEREVARMNEVLANSSLTNAFTFRLVGAFPLDASVKSLGNSNTERLDQAFKCAEEAITGGGNATAAWTAFVEARNRLGADVMMVLFDTGSTSGMLARSVGLGTFNEDKPWNDPGVLEFAAERPLGMCEIASVAGEYTLIHEVGHIMGAGHPSATQVNPQKIAVGPQLFEYSSAYLFETNGTKYFTIMGYPFDGWGATSMTHAPVFSSPDIVFTTEDGIDVVPGVEGVYDNARTLRETAATVAAYRVHTVPYNARSLTVEVTSGGTVEDFPGEVEPGVRVNLKAIPDANYAFSGWYACPADGSDPVLRSKNALYMFLMPDEDLNLRAVFEPVQEVNEGISDILCVPGGYRAGEVIEPLAVEAVSDLPTSISAQNLPPGLSFDAVAGEIRGTPTRPGTFTSTLTARNASGARLAKTVVFRIGNWRDEDIGLGDAYGPFTPGLPVSMSMPEGTAGCRVSGLPPGLSWRATSRMVSGMPTKPGDYTVRFMRGDELASATFTVAPYPQIPLAVSTANGDALEEDETLEVFAGVELKLDVAVDGETSAVSPVTLKVTGLPAGLKYSSAKGVIHGVPTKASPVKNGAVAASVVSITAANKVKWTGKRTFRILVKALPDWACGTFCGGERCGGMNGLFTLSVRSDGRMSGKTVFGKKTVSFTAAGYGDVEGDGERFIAERVFRPNGSSPVTNVLCVTADGYTETRDRGTVDTRTDGDDMLVSQDLLGDGASGVRIVRNCARTFVLTGREDAGLDEGDALQARIGTTGAVSFSGRLGGVAVSASSRLTPIGVSDGLLTCRAAVAFPAKDGSAAGGYAASLLFTAAESSGGVFRFSELELFACQPR